MAQRYLAYCTLLDQEEMRRFCPGARPGEVGRVTGWRVGFGSYGDAGPGGGCHLYPEPDHRVYGLLYELNDDEMTALDTISGVDTGYYSKLALDVEVATGSTMPAITYVIPAPGPFRPSEAYTAPILRGARDLALPEEYIRELETAIAAAQSESTSHERTPEDESEMCPG